MITGDEVVTRIQRRLDDEAGEIWTRAFLLNAAQNGYDRLTRESECLFDMLMYDDQPFAGNHTRDIEEQYMDGPILGRFNYTRESDREFTTVGSRGPANHTRPSDAVAMVSSDPTHQPTSRTVGKLPNNLVSVIRATHHWLRLSPEQDRWFREARIAYQTQEGGVFSYSQDGDGLFYFRTVGVPVHQLPSVEIQGIRGGIRQFDSLYGFDTEVIIGTYGGPRSIPQHFASGTQYGGIRRIVPDDNSTRIEYFRLGRPLSDHPFEIPDRAVRYVEWWAMYNAYKTPGQGENSELAEHFKQRFEYGIEEMKRRINAEQRERTISMGSKRLSRRDAYLNLFPATHGYKRRFRM